MTHVTFPKPIKQRKPRKGLNRSGWIKHRQNLGAIPSNELKAQRAQFERERKAEKFAKQFGCAYADCLRAQFKILGCMLCGKSWGRCELHHTTQKGNAKGGLADDLVFLCGGPRGCHAKGDSPGHSFAELEAKAGVDLKALAAQLAGLGYQLGLLPVEQCAICRRWQSKKDVLDRPLPDGRVERICAVKCAGDGLKESGDESELW